MTKHIYIIVVFFFAVAFSYGQETLNIDLVSHVDVGEHANDIWGYVDASGTEYAIMGSRTATRIFSLEDPANPIERAVIPGAPSIWRDIKSFGDHLYVVADQGTDGLLIIDMSKAPDTITSKFWNPVLDFSGTDEVLKTCHNLYIDTSTGILFLAGCNPGVGGIILYDLNEDKDNPVFLSAENLEYSHDAFAIGDRLYTSEIYTGNLGIYDISDPTNPQLVNTQPTSRSFTHNAWATPDRKTIFTTDERANAWLDAYDISDENDIKFLDRYRPVETENMGVIPHNTHVLDNRTITSWYTDGVVILDVTRPDNMIKVASYDTEPDIIGGFDGCWGAYPFLPSGLILAADINRGLYILQPKRGDTGENGFFQACYLEGKITDINTGQPISGATVKILSDNPNHEESRATGEYKTGQVTPGTFMVEFTHPNYDTLVTSATLTEGEVTILDVQLGNAIVTGIVADEAGKPVPNAVVTGHNVESQSNTSTMTDDEGLFSIGVRSTDEYEIYVGKWGYKSASKTFTYEPGLNLNFELSSAYGYYEDDFFDDFGWKITGDASTGMWELANPEEKLWGTDQVIQPGGDVQGDLGNLAYVTGAVGGGAGNEDVDDGSVILVSPVMNLSENNIFDLLSFDYSFANVGGNTEPNDIFRVDVIDLKNGEKYFSRELDLTEGWQKFEVSSIANPNQEMMFSDSVVVVFTCADNDPGHVVECAVDDFRIKTSFDTSVEDETGEGQFSISPNPVASFLNVHIDDAVSDDLQMSIADMTGKMVWQEKLISSNPRIDVRGFSVGMYVLKVFSGEDVLFTQKFVINR